MTYHKSSMVWIISFLVSNISSNHKWYWKLLRINNKIQNGEIDIIQMEDI